MRGLRGKGAIVTGAASGIGRAIALRLAEEGCRVGIFDRNAAGADETAAAIRAGGGEAMAQPLDITNGDAVVAAVAAFEAKLGPVEILVNNAGWDKAAPFLQTDAALWRTIIDINLLGFVIVGIFVLTWLISLSVWRYGRIEEKWIPVTEERPAA